MNKPHRLRAVYSLQTQPSSKTGNWKLDQEKTMFQDINSFLNRFRTLKPPERYIQESVISEVKETTGVLLRRAEVSVRGKTIYITTAPAAKSEIMLRKSDILRSLSKSLVAGMISDIR